MIDLSTNPFNLNDEQIQKVTKICSDMTLDEKIGQIFRPIGNVQDEKEIDEFIQKVVLNENDEQFEKRKKFFLENLDYKNMNYKNANAAQSIYCEIENTFGKKEK